MLSELENILTNSHKQRTIAFLHSHPEYFDDAIELAVSNKQLLAWRAAWLIYSCMKLNDKRIQPHIKRIVNSISTKENGHQRELIKILSQMELNEQQEGYLFSICSEIWEETNKKPSVRYTALTFMIKIANKYPDLQNEIVLLVQDKYLSSLSPGIKKSIEKMINNIEVLHK